MPESSELREMCSTPFGINGRITSVLMEKNAGVNLCSTPFGINGRITSS